jgi:WD40 repeat protein
MIRLVLVFAAFVQLSSAPHLALDLEAAPRLLWKRDDPFARVRSAAWSPDRKLVAVGTHGVHVRIIDAENGTVVQAMESHFEDINSVAWSPDGQQLASASLDGTLRIWDATSGRVLHALVGHKGSVGAVAWSPDGSEFSASVRD